ncbi:ABC transporter G family member 36-like [Wolffia australiana]
MDSSNIFRVGSLRRDSWRNADSAFPRSTGEEDDEEALKWAALEKLPTYSRVRKGILVGEGGSKEIEIKKLNTQERKILLERLVRIADEDNENFLLKLRSRIDRVGIDLPTIEVRFENLDVTAEAYIGGRALPTVFNSTVNVLEAAANTLRILPSRKKQISILQNVSGVIKPRRLTLLLGPPSSGKTTLLLALCGKLESDVKVSGNITYNGHGLNEFVPERTAAYISQHDLHIGEMTVRETLAFSARCQGVGARYDMLVELSRREKEANIKPDPDIDVFMKAAAMGGQRASVVTDYVLKTLGLDMCSETLVGNEMLRGISGGQKKRVTTGEMLVGPARALFMDEISTGLDSSTTFQIVKALRQSIHILGGTALISLLQPPPETFELFDDIILLSDGQIVYQGPRKNVLEFFEFMGFKCPERKGIADFLQEVTSRKDQRQYWARHAEPYRFVPVSEFANSFKRFHVWKEMENELAVPFEKSRSHPAALTKSKYGVSKKELLKACVERELLLMKRNSFVYIFRSFKIFLMSIVAMTVFLRTRMPRDTVADGITFMGALFFSVVVLMFNGMAEISLTIARLPVFYKQRDFLFYPAWAYALPSWVLNIPITIIEVAIWEVMIYYVIGFDPSVERFFKQYLLLFLASQMASGLFRLVAVVGRSTIIANTFGSFVLLIVLVMGGFIVARENVKKWLRWISWISPLMYAQYGVFVNEFLGKSWNKILPGSTEPLGVLVLRSRSIFTEPMWYWIGVAALIGYALLFNLSIILALHYLNPLGKGQQTVSEESVAQSQENVPVKSLMLTPKGNQSHGKSDEKIENTRTKINMNMKNKRMVLPFVPRSMEFEDIKYSVDMPPEMKSEGDRLELLKGVSGSFRPGVLTALMGVSGAGKTTLMDVLSGRKTGGYIEGKITISGYPKKQETFARISGYCEQNDIHSPNVTVYESLLFSSWLRLPADVDSRTRQMFCEEIMELIELTQLRGALVGLPGVNGLSTEQRKRLTIAVELVANPSIIFMDEPTSGLDARAAAIVMRVVKNIVETGRTVVCTIHQPSIDIFEAFDELFLLKRGGEEIYVGPLGHYSCELIKYFEGIKGVPKIRDGYNPATWMLEVTTLAQEEALGVDFKEIYKNSELYRRNKALIKEMSEPAPNSSDLHFPTQYSRTFATQCMVCLWKQHLSYWRNPSYTAIRLFFTTVIALIFGIIFWNLGPRREKKQDLFNSMGALYSAVLFVGVQNSQSIQPVVAVERSVFYRERAAGMYSAFPYAFGQMAIELPYILVQALLYGVIVYSMIGFEWTAVKFLWFFFFMYFTFLYFTFYGMMAVGLTPNSGISAIISSAFYSVWNLFSGFLIPRPRIPIWWRWYYWACPVSWTLYGLIASQFGDISTIIEDEPVDVFLKNYFGYERDFLWAAATAVVAFGVMFASIFAFSIKYLNYLKR